MIAATIGRPDLARVRPDIRKALIDHALDPLTDIWTVFGTDVLTRLKQDLSVVISAEALFSLIDLSRLSPDDAIASLVRSATAITTAALQPPTLRRESRRSR